MGGRVLHEYRNRSVIFARYIKPDFHIEQKLHKAELLYRVKVI